MKKTYVRPEVYFENFELSTNIATGCSAGYDHNNTNFGTPDQCALFFGTESLTVHQSVIHQKVNSIRATSAIMFLRQMTAYFRREPSKA